MIPLADVLMQAPAGSGLVAPHSNFGPLTISFHHTCDTLTSGVPTRDYLRWLCNYTTGEICATYIGIFRAFQVTDIIF